MSTYSYGERDYRFGQTMATLRTALGLTQAELARFLQVSRRAVGGWESGSSYPKAEHLKTLIELCIHKQTFFPVGQEAEEIHALWKAAHQKVLLDEQWLSTLLKQSRPPFILLPYQPGKQLPPAEPATTHQLRAGAFSAQTPRIDWGEALSSSTFYGREQELDQLEQWIVQERCQVVSILGMGGLGKSALAASLMQRVIKHFQMGCFRSLRNTPSCDTLLDDLLQMLSSPRLGSTSASFDRRISLLVEQLRTVRTLIVLDNLEVLMAEGDAKGRFRTEFARYELLLRCLAEMEHQSCLVLTSRGKPGRLRAVSGKNAPVRFLRLAGLAPDACTQLLTEKEIRGSPQELAYLSQAYGGNPLALKIVAETITELFGGEISQFLSSGVLVFGSICDLLGEHFIRLSALEQSILFWLAIAREPMTIDELQKMLVVPLPNCRVLEAVDSLHRRSLIERGQRAASFVLPPVVLEYATALLIEEVARELQQQQPLHYIIEFGLLQASAKACVQQTQYRLIIAPLLAQLHNAYHERGEVEKLLLSLLEQMHTRASHAQGYGPANLLALLNAHRGHLKDLDLSQPIVRGDYLQGVAMQDTFL
jgi:transcriptional regulator with XRE-family HTH domain/DNA-binding transcriptional regulator GbsR (MarR family)